MAWRVEFDNHQVHDRFDAVIWTDDNRVVARIPQADPVWSDKANARVATEAHQISAAPDLLAALEAVVRAYTDAEAGRMGIEPEDAWQARAGVPPWLARIAFPAIDKAKGGAS